MKTVLLIFGVLFLLWTLYGSRTYFRSSGKSHDALKTSKADLEEKAGKEAAQVIYGAIVVFAICVSLLWIAYMFAVALYFGHGWVTLIAAVLGSISALTLIPKVLRTLAGITKRGPLSYILPPVDAIFLGYLIWVFAR
ncbi:hypothetical protein [Alicyclobacillus sp. ALC3]|uniref:hypothetical protein n=1 Tax=Alicyclobacillus sp. ALC3 TaxID=2796143 RepID=UPI0023797847|nr:hypothetical protein [Alicyclobacillus sp. ALC3]WDL96907.1 hypothetical protein JC200_21950 [Alicyclobacillus sp. ALC3]